MKRLLLALLLLPSVVLAQSTSVWERAAYGNVPGVSFVRLAGLNGAIPATFETVWPESAEYVPLTAALSAPYCASTDANDTSAGTGARTVTVTGITTAFAPFSEVVTMNGQTSVVLATASILAINSMEVTTAGSGLFNAGVIACGTGNNTAGDPAVIHSILPISTAATVANAGNKSESFIYGVAANKTLLCRNITAGSVFATAASSFQVTLDGYTNSTGVMKRYLRMNASNAGANPAVFAGPIKFPEKTIIIGRMAGPTGSNTGPVSMTADCLLIDAGSSNANQNYF